jgi:hypothetical protein
VRSEDYARPARRCPLTPKPWNVSSGRAVGFAGHVFGPLLFALAAVVGCSAGQIGPEGLPGSASNNSSGSGSATSSGAVGGGSGGSGGTVAPACVANASFAPPRLWRLNDQQYANVVHDVFGAGVMVPAEVSEAAAPGSEEPSTDSLTIENDAVVRNYMSTAQTVAAGAAQNLGTLLSCATPNAACVETFIRNKVARAFRRPLTDTEVQDILALYNLGTTPSEGVQVLLEYVLQSPNFLWRTELAGTNPTAASASPQPLGPFEIASALGFLFLDSVPDDALWADAVAGTLTTPAAEAAQVDRLMALPTTKTTLANMVGSWLSIHKIQATVKDATLFPQFTSSVRDELLQSSQLFLQDVVLGGTLTDFVTSSRIYLNAELAGIYGIGGVTGTSLVPVDVGLPQWSGGILTQPAILTESNTHPDRGDVVHRGLFIYNSMICGAPIPPPPSSAAAVNASLPATATERDRATFRDSNPSCLGCHRTFDPFGLLTERYDPIGRYVDKDASGQPIDQSATISVGTSLDGPANGLGDLIARLKSSRQFADCTAGKLVNIALGRVVTTDNSCALQSVRDQFAKAESFTGLIRAVATSQAFLTRDANLH